jgi:hypothetical protein
MEELARARRLSSVKPLRPARSNVAILLPGTSDDDGEEVEDDEEEEEEERDLTGEVLEGTVYGETGTAFSVAEHEED